MKLQFLNRGVKFNHWFEIEIVILKVQLFRVVLHPKYVELAIFGLGFQWIEN